MNRKLPQHPLYHLLATFAAVWSLGAPSTASSCRADDLARIEELAMKAAVTTAAPLVVRIDTIGGLEKVDDFLVGSGPTTGLIVSRDGEIVSSAFNFIQQPTSILVTLADRRKYPARIVAWDRSRMLVLLKIAPESELPVPRPVPPGEMRVGQWTLALGRTYDSDSPNISVGILSATDRIWGKAIQTDAKISPANYGGPLVDLQGRVLGVLVPLSPQGDTELAGAEWYDSGIGFAVPLTDVLAALPRLRQGEDLYPGLLGVTLKGRDQYGNPAVIASCAAGTPAAKAELTGGDVIVRVADQPIQNHVQLKHALGRLYAGDTVDVEVKRGDETLVVNVTLTDRIEPFQHGFLGVLPERTATGVEAPPTVRFVYPDSPAETAGIAPGDVLSAIEGEVVATVDSWRQQIALRAPGTVVPIRVLREGTPRELSVTTAPLPTTVPREVPAAITDETQIDRPAAVVPLKVPEEANRAFALVPASYRADTPHGVVIWLDEPGGFDPQRFAQRWQEPCTQHQLIVLAPQPLNENRWLPAEAAFIRKAVDDVIGKYAVDPQRVVVCGYRAGGTLAYRFAFQQRELIRGMAAIEAPMPLRLQIRGNDPVDRLAFYIARCTASRLEKRIESDEERLQKQAFPVTVREIPGTRPELSEEEFEDISRWVDALDRI